MYRSMSILLVALVAGCSSHQRPGAPQCIPDAVGHYQSEDVSGLRGLSAHTAHALSIKLEKSYATIDGLKLDRVPVDLRYQGLTSSQELAWVEGFEKHREFFISSPCNGVPQSGLVSVTLSVKEERWSAVAVTADGDLLLIMERPL